MTCARCKAEFEGWYVLCDACRERNKEQYRRWKAEHRCVECHADLPEGWTKTRCPECGEKKRILARRYRGRATV